MRCDTCDAPQPRLDLEPPLRAASNGLALLVGEAGRPLGSAGVRRGPLLAQEQVECIAHELAAVEKRASECPVTRVVCEASSALPISTTPPPVVDWPLSIKLDLGSLVYFVGLALLLGALLGALRLGACCCATSSRAVRAPEVSEAAVGRPRLGDRHRVAYKQFFRRRGGPVHTEEPPGRRPEVA